MPRSPAIPRPHYPPVMQEELTGKTPCCWWVTVPLGKEIERFLFPFNVNLVRIARRRQRTEPLVHAVSDLERLLPQAEVVILILPLTEESRGTGSVAGNSA